MDEMWRILTTSPLVVSANVSVPAMLLACANRHTFNATPPSVNDENVTVPARPSGSALANATALPPATTATASPVPPHVVAILIFIFAAALAVRKKPVNAKVTDCCDVTRLMGMAVIVGSATVMVPVAACGAYVAAPSNSLPVALPAMRQILFPASCAAMVTVA